MISSRIVFHPMESKCTQPPTNCRYVQDLLELIQEQFVGERHNYIIGADKADVPEDEDSDIELDEDGDKPLVIPFKLRKNPAAFVRGGQYWARTKFLSVSYGNAQARHRYPYS